MGGYDIFYSTLLDGKWSVPINVGFPLNSTDDDVFFKPVSDGYTGYLARETSGSSGREDIYRIEMFSDQHPRKFLVHGVVRIGDLNSNTDDSVRVRVKSGKGQTNDVYSDRGTGEYKFDLTNGNYEFTYEGTGGEIITRDVTIPINNASDTFLISAITLPKKDILANLSPRTDSISNIASTEVILTKQTGNAPITRPEYERIIAQKKASVLTEILRNRPTSDIPAPVQANIDQGTAIPDIAVAKNIPADKIVSGELKGRSVPGWIITVIIASGLIFFLILFRKKKKA